jgi:hypothetical protein
MIHDMILYFSALSFSLLDGQISNILPIFEDDDKKQA